MMNISFESLFSALTSLVYVLVGYIIYARWNYGSLESLGIPVVKPYLFLGSNYNEAYIDITACDVERQKKYGGIYGVYDGRYPEIHISDPKLIRLITSVDFEYFRNCQLTDNSTKSSCILDSTLDSLNDEKWKIVRRALTPIFTSAKLKKLAPLVEKIGTDYAESLLQQCSQDEGRTVRRICFREFGAPMIIEILGKCFCGIEIPNVRAEDNEFVENMKWTLTHDSQDETWEDQISKIFPFVDNLRTIFTSSDDGMEFFVSLLKNILESREKSGEKSIDVTSTLVDLLIRGRTDPNYARLGVGEDVVLAQAWDLFNSSYGGIRGLFEFFMYRMGVHESIQEEVYNEIKNIVDEPQKEVNLAGVNEMTYLTACLREVSRLHATAHHRLARTCNKDWSHEGIRIPKGTQVVFPTLAIHRNPEYWPNPEKFDPSRFMPGNKEKQNPYAYMPFGQGPRGCLGQRFAMEVLKILIAIFLLRFKIQKREDTICEPKKGGSTILSFKPIFLDVVKR